MPIGSAVGQGLVEVALDAPAPRWLIEAQQLGRLAAFRAGPIHPVAVAGIERAAMAEEVAQLRAAHEAARRVRLAGRVGNGEALILGAGSRGWRARQQAAA